MSAIDVLRDEYPGDVAWQKFVAVFRPAWSARSDKDFFCLKLGDEDIAIVLTASMGDHSIDWFNRPCGALGKRSPADIMKNEFSGINIIKTLLMRMPR